MKSLTLRIYLTVVAVLLLFAFASSWLFQRQVVRERVQERVRAELQVSERLAAWADLIQRSLPPAEAPVDEQAAAVRDWSERLRIPLALHDAQGARIGASDTYARREQAHAHGGLPIRLDDGRTLWIMRGAPRIVREAARERGPGAGRDRTAPEPNESRAWPTHQHPDGPSAVPPWRWPQGLGLLLLLGLLFLAVAGAAWPVARALTRRLNALKSGVEQFGSGLLSHRVDASGNDEVAAVAGSFNQAAERIEALVRSNQSLLANASHELRSPLARMKMALSLLDELPAPEQPGKDGPQRERLKREVRTNIAELDALVEEVLLASRLDANAHAVARESVDLLGLAAEEAARVDAQVEGSAVTLLGDERLLRRALRNLLENAQRYGRPDGPAAQDGISVAVRKHGDAVEVRVSDRGPGIPLAQRERIFEPFFRLPGHSEKAGGVGLGLSLVKQIAECHGGRAFYEERPGGGSCFVITVPLGQ